MRIKPKISLAIALVLACIIVLQVVPVVQSQTNTTGVRVQLNGPPVLGTLRSGEYTATIIDPMDRTWNYKAYVDGSNLTGAAPLLETAANGTLDPGNYTFSFNITAMQRAGDLDIHVNCTSGDLYYEKVQPIIVVSPITISAEIENPTNVQVKNVTVRFLVDGVEFDSQIVDSIPASQSKTISSEWIAADKDPGWHDSTILVDLNGDGIIDKEAGDMIIEDSFYIEGGSDWVFALTVLVGVTALIIGMGFISRRKIR